MVESIKSEKVPGECQRGVGLEAECGRVGTVRKGRGVGRHSQQGKIMGKGKRDMPLNNKNASL